MKLDTVQEIHMLMDIYRKNDIIVFQEEQKNQLLLAKKCILGK